MSAPAPGHTHAWAEMRFELRDGHASVVETCATCGAIRRYRAFERFWDPSTPSGPTGRRQPSSASVRDATGIGRSLIANCIRLRGAEERTVTVAEVASE